MFYGGVKIMTLYMFARELDTITLDLTLISQTEQTIQQPQIF